MKISIVSIVLIIIHSIAANIDHTTIIDVSNMEKIPCVIKMYQKYFKSKRAMKGSLVIVNITPNGSLFQRYILKSLNTDRNHEYAVMIKNARKPHKNAKHVTDKAKYYFFLLTNSREIPPIIAQLKMLPTWNPLSQVLILFTVEIPVEDTNAEFLTIFNYLYNSSMLNVNIMYPVFGTSKIEMITWFPYRNGNCANIVQDFIIIDECEQIITVDNTTGEMETTFKEFNIEDGIPIKLPDNLNGCPLKISAGVWVPFVKFDKTKGINGGLEVLMLNRLAQKLNMKPIYTIQNTTRSNTVNGLEFYSNLIRMHSDVMIGGLDENPVTRKNLSSTIPYYQDDLTWCVAEARLSPTWSNVFVIFSLSTWLAALFIIIVAAYFLYKFVKIENLHRENLSWAFMISLAVSLSCPTHYYPTRGFVRIFFITLVVYGMHFNAAYHSFLISVLTRPRYDVQVNTIEMAIENNYRLVGGVNVLSHYKKDDATSEYVSNAYVLCENIDKCLEKLNTDDHLGVAVSREHAKNSDAIQESEMFCFPRINNIYSFSVTMLFRRDYHLLPKINDIVRSFLESGLIVKWNKESQLIRKMVKQSITGGHGEEYIDLTVDHIVGSFYIGFIGITLSILSFICELIIYRFGDRLKFVCVKNFVEKLFC